MIKTSNDKIFTNTKYYDSIFSLKMNLKYLILDELEEKIVDKINQPKS